MDVPVVASTDGNKCRNIGQIGSNSPTSVMNLCRLAGPVHLLLRETDLAFWMVGQELGLHIFINRHPRRHRLRAPDATLLLNHWQLLILRKLGPKRLAHLTSFSPSTQKPFSTPN